MSDNHSEKLTAASNPDIEDEWQIVEREDTRPDGLGEGDKKEVIQEKTSDSSETEKRELAQARWEGVQPLKGGVYPDREVKTPSYPQFTGNW